MKRAIKSGKDLEQLLFVVQKLSEGRQLPAHSYDHPLKGKHIGKRDYHLGPDWILIYAIEDDELVLYRTGSHSDLFQ